LPRITDRDCHENLYEKVDRYKLVENLEACLQCGRCTGACPVASLSPSYNPRQIIRDVLAGFEDRWLKSEEIWRCFWCANCYGLCPADINYPLLMMQLRFLAVENNYGVKYVSVFKRFAIAAWHDGLTFAPRSDKGREKIKIMRAAAGLPPWPEVSDKAKAEYNAIFDLTAARASIEAIDEEDDRSLDLTYMEGRIRHEDEKNR